MDEPPEDKSYEVQYIDIHIGPKNWFVPVIEKASKENHTLIITNKQEPIGVYLPIYMFYRITGNQEL